MCNNASLERRLGEVCTFLFLEIIPPQSFAIFLDSVWLPSYEKETYKEKFVLLAKHWNKQESAIANLRKNFDVDQEKSFVQMQFIADMGATSEEAISKEAIYNFNAYYARGASHHPREDSDVNPNAPTPIGHRKVPMIQSHKSHKAIKEDMVAPDKDSTKQPRVKVTTIATPKKPKKLDTDPSAPDDDPIFDGKGRSADGPEQETPDVHIECSINPKTYKLPPIPINLLDGTWKRATNDNNDLNVAESRNFIQKKMNKRLSSRDTWVKLPQCWKENGFSDLPKRDGVALLQNMFLGDELLVHFMQTVTHEHENIHVVTHHTLAKLVNIEQIKLKFQLSSEKFDRLANKICPKDHLQKIKDGLLIFYFNYPSNEHFVFVAVYGKPSSGYITIEVRNGMSSYAEQDNVHIGKCVALALHKIFDSRLRRVKFTILQSPCPTVIKNTCAIHVIAQCMLFAHNEQMEYAVRQETVDRIRAWILHNIYNYGDFQ